MFFTKNKVGMHCMKKSDPQREKDNNLMWKYEKTSEYQR